MNSNIIESNFEQHLPALSDFFYKSDSFNYYSLLNSENKLEIRFPEFVDGKRKLANNQASFYKIETLSFDDEYPRREAFENVLFAVDEPKRNFVYILEGNQNGISMYIEQHQMSVALFLLTAYTYRTAYTHQRLLGRNHW